jgi:hypothetical protein
MEIFLAFLLVVVVGAAEQVELIRTQELVFQVLAVEVVLVMEERVELIFLTMLLAMALLEMLVADMVLVAVEEEQHLAQLTAPLQVQVVRLVAELVVLCMSMLNKTLSPQVN